MVAGAFEYSWAKEMAMASYLEAKNIKNTYMLDDIEDSDDSDIEMSDME